MGWRGREVDSGQLAITGMGNVDGVEVAEWTVLGSQFQIWEMSVVWKWRWQSGQWFVGSHRYRR